ncbi:MAG: ribonuclease III [Desulfobacterales bacterium]|jgi:ribonuclease-3|nr:ribonuclease III [Desulfobacterales bacterium]
MDLEPLEQNISYTFTNKALIQTALQHSSFVNENPAKALEDNERLEFLGDAILNAIISHLLMTRHPELKEGELSKIRSLLVNKTHLAKVAKQINLGQFLRLGKGEVQSSGRKKASILADAFEALLAAVYLDGGFDQATLLIQHLFEDFFNTVSTPWIYFDYKSRLQELVQAALKSQPEYVIISENGPDHDKTFEVELSVGDVRTRGKGKSKKTAEQEAAKLALELLHVQE